MKFASVASNGVMAEAMNAALVAGGSATDAVAGAYAAQAGVDAAGVFRPMIAMVAGIGAGRRVFDGRSVQPGLSLARPRGFRAGDPIPDGAQMAVPRGLAAMWVMQGRFGRLAARTVWAPGVEAARASGAKVRAAWLREAAQAGPSILSRGAVLETYVALGGPVYGGCVSEADFEVRSSEAFDRELGSESRSGIALAGDLLTDAADFAGSALVAAAADAYGLVATMAIGVPSGETPLEDLELSAPWGAKPVERGVTRLAPGTRLPCKGTLALFESTDLGLGAMASPGGAFGVSSLETALGTIPIEDGFAQLSTSGAPLLAVRTHGEGARAWTLHGTTG